MKPMKYKGIPLLWNMYDLWEENQPNKQTNKSDDELQEVLTKWKQEPCSFWKQEYFKETISTQFIGLTTFQ